MSLVTSSFLFFFFFNDTATTEIYTLSLHDALPISSRCSTASIVCVLPPPNAVCNWMRSEEHTSELQSPVHLVCRLLLAKKNHAPGFTLSGASQARDDASVAATRSG